MYQFDKSSETKFAIALTTLFKSNSSKEKEILSLKRELHDTADEFEKYADVRKFYKGKLVELGVMKEVKGINKTTAGHFTKIS